MQVDFYTDIDVCAEPKYLFSINYFKIELQLA